MADRREYQRGYYQKNRDRLTEKYRVVKAALEGLEGSHTEQERRAILKICGGKCQACGSPEGVKVVYNIPLHHGGSAKPGTMDVSNLVPLCKRCRRYKNRLPVRYLQPPEARGEHLG